MVPLSFLCELVLVPTRALVGLCLNTLVRNVCMRPIQSFCLIEKRKTGPPARPRSLSSPSLCFSLESPPSLTQKKEEQVGGVQKADDESRRERTRSRSHIADVRVGVSVACPPWSSLGLLVCLFSFFFFWVDYCSNNPQPRTGFSPCAGVESRRVVE